MTKVILLATVAAFAAAKSNETFPFDQPKPAPKGYKEYESPVILPVKDVDGSGSWAPAVQQARDIVKNLTFAEMVNVTTGTAMDRCVGHTGSIPRIGFEGVCYMDGPLGVRGIDGVSVFPPGITVAATFDKKLMFERGRAWGQEHHDKGSNVALGPFVNLMRTPQEGRGWEGFGADPYLSGIAGAETIKGAQGTGVIASVKHFLGNEQEHYRGTSGLTAGSSNMDDRTLRELYLWPFVDAIRADVGNVLCGYNRLNQTYVCENSYLLNKILKQELNFQGHVVSDWWAMVDGMNPALTGLDVSMPGGQYATSPNEYNPVKAKHDFWGPYLLEGLKNGTIPEDRLRDMATRTIATLIHFGQWMNESYPPVSFDNRDVSSPANQHINVQGDHYKVIRKIGAEGAVLLKNEHNVLPLKSHVNQTIGVFGSDAGPSPYGINNKVMCSDNSCNNGTLAQGWGSGSGWYPYLTDPQLALHIRTIDYDTKLNVTAAAYDKPDNVTTLLAKEADVALVFVNADSGEEYITVEGNMGDRNNLSLWHDGDALIKHVAKYNKNVVVVIHTVGAVLVNEWINHPNVKAVINAGLPGQESGNSLVDVLFGDTNPSGRLPYTMGKKESDYPAKPLYNSSREVPQITYSEGLFIDYRWFDKKNITPEFEFGFGLSYTSFEYSGLQVSGFNKEQKRDIIVLDGRLDRRETNLTAIPAGGAFDTLSPELFEPIGSVEVTVKNTGDYDGAEVAQLYLGFPKSVDEPPRVLRGFDKHFIPKGQSVQFHFDLVLRDIAIWDVVKQKWTIPHGKFTIDIGASSRDIRLSHQFSS